MQLIIRSMARSLGLLATVAAAMWLGGSTARATLVTINMEGTVSSVDQPLGGTFSSGQTFNLSYTFDTAIAARTGSDSTSAVFDALTHLQLSIGGYSASSSAAQEIQIDNDPTLPDHDRYAVVSRTSDGLSGPSVSGMFLESFIVRLDDSTNAVFSNALDLPSSLDLTDFDSTAFFLTFQPIVLSSDNQIDALTGPFIVSGTIKSITEPTVPEPATLGLVALGLGGLGMLRRRRRARA